jgi:polar amino acid transport system substrate-binding protein
VKRILAAACLAITALSAVAAPVRAASPSTVTAGKLTWGASPTFAPFEYQRDGQTVGFDVDLVAELAKRLGLQSSMLGMDFAGIVPAVQAGRIDAVVSGMYITPARAEVIDFIGYLKIGDQMVVPKGNPAHLAGRDALCGHHIAVAVNTLYEKTAHSLSDACVAAGKPAIDILAMASSAVVALTLAQGRAEGAISSTSVITAMMANSPDTFEPLGEPFNTDSKLGMGVAKTNPGLRDALTVALKAMHDDGSYDALIRKWGLPAASSIF